MTERPLAFRTAGELMAMMRAGALAPGELLDCYLERIRRHDGTARAYITVTEEIARDAARRAGALLDEGASAPALAGLPYAVKDVIDAAGVLTTGGSRVLHDNVATENARSVDLMAAAGAVLLGKANLHEFAYGATGTNPLTGTATNPYDPTRLAGGSSSGSAAAVGYGLAAAALATDTGGSTRVPASLSGLVGLKPTMGRISTRGVIPVSWSLDHVGTVTRSVGDAALLLQALAGFDPGDPGSADVAVGDYLSALDQPIDGMTIGVPERFYFERADGEILAAVEAALRALEERGARLVKVALPSMDHTRAVSLTVQMPEALSYHSRYLGERGDLYGADFRAGLALGQCLLAEHYVRAKRLMESYRRETNAVLREVDVLVTPATPIVAPRIGTEHVTIDGVREALGNALTRYTSFFNLTGHPAITVPVGLHSEGLPMAVQIVGGAFDEAGMLRAAAAVERDDRFRIPLPAPLCAGDGASEKA
jgi:aspartyl-tRNA(Asn)/glutamyl-tRNA(Gln) amidotransferase subunit A